MCMEELIIIEPVCREAAKSKRLREVVNQALKNEEVVCKETGKQGEVNKKSLSDLKIIKVERGDQLATLMLQNKLQNTKIIFAISLGESGVNLEYYNMLKIIRTNQNIFEGSVGGIIVDGQSELYTKNISREVVLAANMSGCTFVGKPLVEGTVRLQNFNIIAKYLNTDNLTAYYQSVKTMVKKVIEFEKMLPGKNILALHSGSRKTSNSLTLWDMVKENIKGEVKEISIRNGTILDCKGCDYETCLHFGEKDRCVYGGIITKEVYPAIIECDALVMICPNYNDAMGANLTAFINRITALFRTHDFSQKKLYGIVVSGYSGGDIVGGQLVSSLNMNKSFILPARFAMMETANNPREIVNIKDIRERAKKFGKKI